jgi:hypothetical protein
MLYRITNKNGEVANELWFDTYRPDKIDNEGKKISQGRVCLSLELVPEEEAKKKVCGLG